MTLRYDDGERVPPEGATIDIVVRLRWHASQTESPLLAGDLQEAAMLISSLRRVMDVLDEQCAALQTERELWQRESHR